MSGVALRLRGVHKRYGRLKALDGLDLEVPAGAICGLVGPNGAGKTTAFGVVGGYVRPDQGEVDVLGEGPLQPHHHAGRVTLLPQDCALNEHTTVGETLRYYGRLQGLGRVESRREADRVLDAVQLADRAGSRVRQLSHGMRRRVQVAQAFLGSPELVLLDEPMGGLDPHLVVAMRSFFLSQRGERTLVISSHVLHELEAICDHVIFLEEGRCVRAGSMAELTGRGQLVRILLDGEAETFLAQISEVLPEVDFVAEGAWLRAQAPSEWTIPRLNEGVLRALIEVGAPILELRPGRGLEETWMADRRA